MSVRSVNNVILRLEGMPGSHVKDIGQEMVDVCNRLGVVVSLDMNGTHLLAFPGYTTLKDIEREYRVQIKSRTDTQGDA